MAPATSLDRYTRKGYIITVNEGHLPSPTNFFLMLTPRPRHTLLLLALGFFVACSSPYEENEQQMIDDERTTLITSEVGSSELDTTYRADGRDGQPVVGTVTSYGMEGTRDFSFGGPTNRLIGDNVWADPEVDDLEREFEGQDPSQVDDEYTYDYRNVINERIGSVDLDDGYPNRPLVSNPGTSVLGNDEPRSDGTPFIYDPAKRSTEEKLYRDEVFTYEAYNNRTLRRNRLGIQLEEAPEITDLAGEAVVPKVVGYEDDMVPNAAADEAVSRSIYAEDYDEDDYDMDAYYRAKGPIDYTTNSLFWAYTTNSPARGNYSSVLWAGGKTYDNPKPNLSNAEMVDGDGYTPLPVPRDEQ